MKNTKVIIYIAILIFCFIICSPLLQMHIASDTYNLMDLGYFDYPNYYFLRDARIVSTLFTYIAGLLNLDYSVFIIFMEVLAIFISSISIYILYNLIIEKTKETNRTKKLLFLIGTILIIFNYMALEYFLYAESAVMCLSVLFSIISAKYFLEDKKYSNIKSLILLIMASYCYQGSISIFISLVILILFIDKNKYSIRYISKKIMFAFIIYAICCIINILTIHIINLRLSNSQERIAGGTIINNLFNFKDIISFILARVLITNFNLLPYGTLIFFIILSTCIITFSQKSSDKTIKYVILILLSFIICIIPSFFMIRPGIEARSSMSIGSIIGMSIIFLNYVIDHNTKFLKYIMITLSVFCLTYNTINTLYIFNSHIITNKIDNNMGNEIKEKIDEYESKTGNTITKVAYCGDKNERDYLENFNKKLASFNQRAFGNKYCIIEALNYYCNRKFEKIEMNSEIYERNFKDKDWDIYCDEQIVFEDDIMYFCMY